MNVQNHIIKGIKELLYSNNYLVIPNFGGFVLKQSSSHFSNSTGILNPPSKIVSFNKQLKQKQNEKNNYNFIYRNCFINKLQQWWQFIINL
jgi:hypothetical protein